MRRMTLMLAMAAACAVLTAPASAQAASAADGEKIYNKRCKMCHALDRKKVGPAFKDMNRDPEVLRTTITNGRRMMPAWGKKLSQDEIESLVLFIQKVQAEAGK